MKGERFGSVEEAVGFASNKLADIRSILLAINTFGGGDATVGGTYEWLDDQIRRDDPVHALTDARNSDRLEGSRMGLFVNVEHLKVIFGLESVLETVDGKLQIRPFDIEHGGKAILRSVGDGTTAPYRLDGTMELDGFA